jgi:hypothetical protein
VKEDIYDEKKVGKGKKRNDGEKNVKNAHNINF